MKTLVLNVDFTPLGIISSERAVVLDIRSKVQVIEYYDCYYRSENLRLKVPSVVLYKRHVKFPVRNKPTKRQILVRDNMKCQYCESSLQKDTATVDHIVPISFFKTKEDSNTWENMVACCKKCNSYKKMRTPEQANMKLKTEPKKPHGFLINKDSSSQWKTFVN